ncbi:AAA family ATPase [Nonomuraea sp. NPDC049158]|uniref:ATP-binding protein n=1 Tax=Nonomuraea sp. NPDC049158 TaxID=3155649 RepID=UPI003404033C
MLYGRSVEISALDEVIARARDGVGGAVVLRGKAGAGKTALLDAAAARGGEMRVLRTTGVDRRGPPGDPVRPPRHRHVGHRRLRGAAVHMGRHQERRLPRDG